jgi:hypothetical protein
VRAIFAYPALCVVFFGFASTTPAQKYKSLLVECDVCVCVGCVKKLVYYKWNYTFGMFQIMNVCARGEIRRHVYCVKCDNQVVSLSSTHTYI